MVIQMLWHESGSAPFLSIVVEQFKKCWLIRFSLKLILLGAHTSRILGFLPCRESRYNISNFSLSLGTLPFCFFALRGNCLQEYPSHLPSGCCHHHWWMWRSFLYGPVVGELVCLIWCNISKHTLLLIKAAFINSAIITVSGHINSCLLTLSSPPLDSILK